MITFRITKTCSANLSQAFCELIGNRIINAQGPWEADALQNYSWSINPSKPDDVVASLLDLIGTKKNRDERPRALRLRQHMVLGLPTMWCHCRRSSNEISPPKINQGAFWKVSLVKRCYFWESTKNWSGSRTELKTSWYFYRQDIGSVTEHFENISRFILTNRQDWCWNSGLFFSKASRHKKPCALFCASWVRCDSSRV